MSSAPMGSASGERIGREDGHPPWAPGAGDSTPTGASAARDRCHEWRLPSTASSVTVLRRGLHAFLQGTSLSGEQLYDLLLAACEAASNAIEHAQHPSESFFDVLTEVDDEWVSILVRDFGEWREAIAGPHRGRGLGMMRALADMSLVSQPGGTTVTLRSRGVDVRPPEPGNAARDPADGDGRNVPRPPGS
jgi:anti-sigma regulatory factor (Ser/Thr protein kinase)